MSSFKHHGIPRLLTFVGPQLLDVGFLRWNQGTRSHQSVGTIQDGTLFLSEHRHDPRLTPFRPAGFQANVITLVGISWDKFDCFLPAQSEGAL